MEVYAPDGGPSGTTIILGQPRRRSIVPIRSRRALNFKPSAPDRSFDARPQDVRQSVGPTGCPRIATLLSVPEFYGHHCGSAEPSVLRFLFFRRSGSGVVQMPPLPSGSPATVRRERCLDMAGLSRKRTVTPFAFGSARIACRSALERVIRSTR